MIGAASATALTGTAAAAPAAPLTAGTAAAAPAQGYVNELFNTYYADFFPDPEKECRWGEDVYNNHYYGNVNGTSDQFFYCATGANGNWNLWWRKWV